MKKLVIVCDVCKTEWDALHHGLGTSISLTIQRKDVVSTSVEAENCVNICTSCSTEFLWFMDDFLKQKSSYVPVGLEKESVIYNK